jgi:hypothetical protein
MTTDFFKNSLTHTHTHIYTYMYLHDIKV